MPSLRRIPSSFLLLLLAIPVLLAQAPNTPAPDQNILNRMAQLRSLPDAERPSATVKLAHQIAAMPPGTLKVNDADALSNLVTEGDQGAATLQAVADALSKSLTEFPVPADPKNPQQPKFYMDLARLVRYYGVTTTLNKSLYLKSLRLLAANDADIEKQDFILSDTHGHPVRLSSLRGKIVLVNFWATWCPPCRVEMPALDALSARYASQGLVVLSITDEGLPLVTHFLAKHKYHPTVLLDPGAKVKTRFHVEGIPRTYLLGRDGKLVAEAVDERSPAQFRAMLSKTGLH